MQLADINNIRAMIVLNIGKDTMTASELLWNGCYLGSNVSYNLKKLTEMGYVEQNRCAYDKRVIMVSNSDKGADLCAALNERVATRLAVLSETGLKTDDIGAARGSLRALQQFCALAAGSRGAGQGERMDVETPATRPGLAA